MPKPSRDPHGWDTDTVIERMEAQFEHETRRPPVVVDSPGEVSVYLDPHASGVESDTGHAHFIAPVVDASQARWWHRVAHAEVPSESLPSYAALRATQRMRVLTRAQALAAAAAKPADRETRLVSNTIDRVPIERREQFEEDVKYVLRRLGFLFSGRQGEIWLESYNYNLGARPIDVLIVGATSEVISAIESEEQGAF